MLGQRTEVGVGTWVNVAGPLADPVGGVLVAPGPPEIVNEVGYRFPQRNATRDPICCPGKGHRMPGPRRQKVTQFAGVVIPQLREDPLRWSAHVTKCAAPPRAGSLLADSVKQGSDYFRGEVFIARWLQCALRGFGGEEEVEECPVEAGADEQCGSRVRVDAR